MQFCQIFLVIVSAFLAVVEASPKLAECGGDIMSDSDTLTYPGPGESLQPGDICVWTVHLLTRINFRFEIRDLSIGSNYTDCRDGGLRFYSLTNLGSPGNPEDTTYCSQRPPASSLVVPNSVAVIILYVGAGNTDPGFGFNISWSGFNLDPLRTQHTSTFSTAFQGIIKYPIVDQYEPNLAATWLVKTVSSLNATRSDFSLNNIFLESCSSPGDRCICDALILYEITEGGSLIERERFCGETSSALIPNIESRFILAFFTDFETEDIGDGGFEVTYFPTTTPPTTTVATTTTTATEGPITDTPCGMTIESEFVSGIISYKAGELYAPNERCVWTLRIPNAWGIEFNLRQSGISGSDPDDGIAISTFRRADPPLVRTEFMRYEGLPVTMNGSVAIITFVTNGASEGLGFVLEYRAAGFNSGNISRLSTDFISTSSPGSFDYPSDRETYDNSELSTFVISTPGFSLNGSPRLNATWTLKELEGNCYDFVILYKFYPGAFEGWSQYDSYCVTSPRTTSHNDMLLYVFKSDSSGVSTGWSLSWIEG